MAGFSARNAPNSVPVPYRERLCLLRHRRPRAGWRLLSQTVDEIGGVPIDHVLVPREEYARFFLCEARPAREVVLPAPLRGLPASLARAAAAR
jgi:hypothetical protein